MVKIPSDKIKHFAVCMLVSLSVSLLEMLIGARFAQYAIAGFSAGVAIGIGKEYGDHCAAGNKWDWYDLIADTLGAIVGFSILSLLDLLFLD